MPDPSLPNTPGLSVTISADWLSGHLRADRLRESLIRSLGEAWLAKEGPVMDALDALAKALEADAPAEEVDARVADVESLSDDAAYVDVDLETALRLRAELDVVIAKLGRFGTAQPSPEVVRLRAEVRSRDETIRRLTDQVAELQAANEALYREDHDATGGPRLGDGEHAIPPAEHVRTNFEGAA